MRITYVTETWPPELNGVSLTVERSVRYLRSRGHDVELIRPRQRGEAKLDAADELRTAGCAIPMYPELRFGLASVAALARRFEQTRPELVHLATPGPLAWAALAAAGARGIATTSDFRTNFHQYSRYYGFGFLAGTALGLLRRFHNLTRRTFVPTRSVRRELAAAGFHNLTLVGRGVDTERFAPAWRSRALRQRWGARRRGAGLSRGRPGRGGEERRARHPGLRSGARASGPTRAWSSSATGRRGRGSRRRTRRCTSPACGATPTWRRTTRRPTSSSFPAFPTPSATSSWRRSPRRCRSSPFDCAAAAEHLVDGRSGQLVVPGDDAGFIAAVREFALAAPQSLAPMRAAAVAAARRAGWDEVLARFEARLQDTVDAIEETSDRVPVVA